MSNPVIPGVQRTAASAPAGDLRRPPRRGATWSLMLACVAVCVLPGWWGIDADTKAHMEKIAVLSSQETWFRQRVGMGAMMGRPTPGPDAAAWRVPTWNGNVRVNKPPAVVWLNMLAWSDLDPLHAEPQQLLRRARGVGLALAALALAATFWAGMSLGGRGVAVVGTLAAGTGLLLLRHERMATYDIPQLAFATLGIAAGFWAMGLDGAAVTARRRAAGWALAGLSLGVAGLCKSLPMVGLIAGVPLAVGVVASGRRKEWAGLAGAAALMLAVAGPWHVFAAVQVSGGFGKLLHEWRAARSERDPLITYLVIVPAAAPWMVWLIGGLIQPWIAGVEEHRRRILRVSWWWLVLIVGVLTIPAAKHERYAVPLIPAVGLLIGQAWAVRRNGAEAEEDRGYAIQRWVHWGMLAVGSAGLPLYLVRTLGLGAARAAAAGGLLLLIAWLGATWHARRRIEAAAWATAGWAAVAASLFIHTYAASPAGQNPRRAIAEQIRERVGRSPLVYVPDLSDAEEHEQPNDEILFYTQRVVPPATLDAVRAEAERGGPLFVISAENPQTDAAMKAAGFVGVYDFKDRADISTRRLYRLER